MAVFIYNDKKYFDLFIEGKDAFSFYADPGLAYACLKRNIGELIILHDSNGFDVSLTLGGVSLYKEHIYLVDKSSKIFLSFVPGDRFPDNCLIRKKQIDNDEAKAILGMGAKYITNSRRLYKEGPKVGTNDYSHKILAIEYALDVNIDVEFTSVIKRVDLHKGDILLVAKFSGSSLDKLFRESKKEKQEKILANSSFRFEKFTVEDEDYET